MDGSSFTIPDLGEVVADVLGREIGVEVALGQSDEELRHAATGRREDLARGLTPFVCEVRHERADLARVECLREAGEHVLGHAGEADRGDGVDLDVELAALDREDAREADEAHLRSAVVGLAEVAEDARVRARVDDAAEALVAHDHPGRHGHVERTHEVGRDHGLEELRSHVVERLVAQDAGVVDDDVDGAEGVEGGLHDGFTALGGGDRVVVGDSNAAELLDLLDDEVRRAVVVAFAIHAATEVVDDHEGTATRQLESMAAAEATSGSGDDGDLAIQGQGRLSTHVGNSFRLSRFD